MISVVLYGRNDSYGYNLHKRAAISLNCTAAVLDGADDEIIFVDYNSPDSMPTFVEAIRDTLTSKAKWLIRVLRCDRRTMSASGRPPTLRAWNRYPGMLLCGDPIRPIGGSFDQYRRGRCSDVTRSLTAIAAEFDDGFYQLPRFEIPESLPVGFDHRFPSQDHRWNARVGWLSLISR